MELSQLRYFLEVARNEHMTKSAEKLHIAQPALTQAIHRLEENLGVPLFVPKGRNIVLTEYGKYLQKRLIPIIEEIDKLPEQLQMMANIMNDTVHLSVLAASSLVTEAIIEYKRSCRDLNFQLIQDPQNDIYDIEITSEAPHRSSAQHEQLNKYSIDEKIYLAVPNNEKFANRKSIYLDEVREEGFISLFGSKQFRNICDKYCRHAGFSPHMIFESDNPSAVKNMIAANMGIGFWPEFTWGRVDNSDVLLLEIADMQFKRDIVISYNSKNKLDNTNINDFYEFLKKFCYNKRKEST